MGLTGCNDWLDVSPKSQIKEEDHFSREGGFRDQLTGVYTRMCGTSMYGLNMGIGFTEVLSQNYDISSNSDKWRYAAEYDYTNSTCEGMINSIWQETYNCIANLNVLLQNIDKADRSIFSDNNYYLFKGEALGLRAFLHFELMRLFAASPAMDNGAPGVPYVTEYSTDVTGQKTVGETMKLIIGDLEQARECLEHDSLKIGQSPYSFRSERICYFNYYAAVATMARAYLWMGDEADALDCAGEIVDLMEDGGLSHPFSWISKSNLDQTNATMRDLAFTTEHIFNLKIQDWESTANYYLKSAGGDNALSPGDSKAMDIYEYNSGLGNDYRYLRGYEQDGENRYFCKFWYITGSPYNDIYPILRLSEVYYIAAECLRNTDSRRAVELLNTVRAARNLDVYPLPETLGADDIQKEIAKEYRKEFVGEGGQLFYYYKRLNASEIPGAAVRPGKSVYVLPVPSSDVEFGGYEN